MEGRGSVRTPALAAILAEVQRARVVLDRIEQQVREMDMVEISNLKDPSPWHPIKDPVDLKHLGKLGEELNEAGAAVSRCIIQGVDEVEPVTGRPNREWLENELADVQANIDLCIMHFGLNEERMFERSAKKMKHLKAWHDMA